MSPSIIWKGAAMPKAAGFRRFEHGESVTSFTYSEAGRYPLIVDIQDRVRGPRLGKLTRDDLLELYLWLKGIMEPTESRMK